MTGSREPLVDALKVAAAQAIVLHHLAFYGPMSDHAALLAPALFEWLARHARIAVQVFLVVGGYLAARQLAPLARGPDGIAIGPLVLGRYLRLVVPYAVMLVAAIAAAALARSWMDHGSVPAAPSWDQGVAHLLLLQDVLGVDALSAGVWYVAIDFQLYVLFLGMLWLARRLDGRSARPSAPWLVAVLVVASLYGFNRDPAWDIAAPYFVGAYGLGVLAAWYPLQRRRWLLVLAIVVVVVALVLEWRSRIVLASAAALGLALFAGRWQSGGDTALAYWADRSYALFLIHFPVLLLVNVAFTRWVPATPSLQLAGVLAAWAASLGAAIVFHRWVERPAVRWRSRAGPSRLGLG